MILIFQPSISHIRSSSNLGKSELFLSYQPRKFVSYLLSDFRQAHHLPYPSEKCRVHTIYHATTRQSLVYFPFFFLPSGPKNPSKKFPNTLPAVPFPARMSSTRSARGSSPAAFFLRPLSSNLAGRSTVTSEAGLATRSISGLRELEFGSTRVAGGSVERRRLCRRLSGSAESGCSERGAVSRSPRRSSSGVESVSSPAS